MSYSTTKTIIFFYLVSNWASIDHSPGKHAGRYRWLGRGSASLNTAMSLSYVYLLKSGCWMTFRTANPPVSVLFTSYSPTSTDNRDASTLEAGLLCKGCYSLRSLSFIYLSSRYYHRTDNGAVYALRQGSFFQRWWKSAKDESSYKVTASIITLISAYEKTIETNFLGNKLGQEVKNKIYNDWMVMVIS